MLRPDDVRTRFRETFGRDATGLASAPGRVNLIGEHTDYNDGFVLPIAIERRIFAAFAPREDRQLHLATTFDHDNRVTVDISQQLVPVDVAWANYPLGVAGGLIDAGVALPGCELLFGSNVPVGSGLSSSAALEVATAMALLAAAGAMLEDRDLALLCQKAENTFAGAPCGIMDQSIAVMGKPGQALLLDCRNGSTRLVPFDDPRGVLLVVDTEVEHSIGGGEYGRRRATCEVAARAMGIDALRDATEQQVQAALADGTLDDLQARRARHVTTEIARTLQAVDALEAGGLAEFGRLMFASHESLRDDYEVSCSELDEVVASARRCDGVYGARMTGGGFGGCAIVLVEADCVEDVTKRIQADFEKLFGRRPPVFSTRPAEGAMVCSSAVQW